MQMAMAIQDDDYGDKDYDDDDDADNDDANDDDDEAASTYCLLCLPECLHWQGGNTTGMQEGGGFQQNKQRNVAHDRDDDDRDDNDHDDHDHDDD